MPVDNSYSNYMPLLNDAFFYNASRMCICGTERVHEKSDFSTSTISRLNGLVSWTYGLFSNWQLNSFVETRKPDGEICLDNGKSRYTKTKWQVMNNAWGLPAVLPAWQFVPLYYRLYSTRWRTVNVSLACGKAHARSVESAVRVDSTLGGNTTPEVIG